MSGIKEILQNNLPATVLWVATFLLAPVPGILMKDKKSIIIGAAIALTLLVWTGAFLLIKSIQTEKKETPAVPKEITLSYLFENDFNNLLRHGETRTIEDNKGNKTSIKSKLYLDFEAQSEFVGFFIPSTPETFNIVAYLSSQIQPVLDSKSKVIVEMSGPGVQPVNSSELKFSERVFIYHEYPILESQKRELYSIYEKHGLALQFRGSDYLFKKKEIVKKIH